MWASIVIACDTVVIYALVVHDEQEPIAAGNH